MVASRYFYRSDLSCAFPLPLHPFFLLAGWNADMMAETQLAPWSMRWLWELSPYKQSNKIEETQSLRSSRSWGTCQQQDRVSLDFNTKKK